MGCDGGTIAARRDLIVKEKKKQERIGRNTEALFNWTSCRLTRERLDRKHVVCCKFGYLYNKKSLIEALLKKKQDKKYKLPKELSHVKSLKDVYDVLFSLNEDFNEKEDDPMKKAMFICPITMKEVAGTSKFYFMKNCGHVVGEKALKLMKGSNTKIQNDENSGIDFEKEEEKGMNCLVCEKRLKSIEEDCILLNPSKEEIEKLKEKFKKEKKKRKIDKNDSNDSLNENKKNNKKKKRKFNEEKKERGGITNETKKIVHESNLKNDKMKDESSVYSSMFLKKGKQSIESNNNDFLTRSFNDLVG